MRICLKFILSVICCLGMSSVYAENTMSNTIQGLKDEMLDNAMSVLEIAQKSKTPPSTAKIKEQFHDGKQQVLDSLKPFGYFRAKLTSELVEDGDDTWNAYYFVDKAQGIPISNLEIQITGPGNTDKRILRYEKHLPIKKGDVFNSIQYRKTKRTLLELANSRGYAKAYFDKSIVKIDLFRYRVAIVLHFNTGKKYFLGPVSFEKNPMDPAFLQRYVQYKKNEHFTAERVTKLQDDLSASQYFSHVIIDANIDKAIDARVPLNVKLAPRKKYAYNYGGGFGTDTGPRASIGWEDRRVTNTGHTFGLQGQFSQISSMFQAKYTIPGLNPVTDQYFATLTNTSQLLDEDTSRTLKFAAGYNFQWRTWHTSLQLGYQFDSSQQEGQSTHRSKYLIPSVNVSKIQAKDPLFATNGYKINLLVQGATKQIVSKTTFIQSTLNLKYIKTIFDPLRLVLRGDLGYTIVHQKSDLPVSLQYYTGGSNSIRGFGYSHFGPARYLFVASVELQQRVYGKLYVVGFYDMGNAMDSFDDPIHRSAGAGFMYASPIGPIELTLAESLSTKNPSHKIEFAMGPDF